MPAGAKQATGKHSGGTGAGKPAATDNKAVPVAPPVEAPPSWLRMAKWTALAFVPSSLMLGVTFHMTTDIASIPLLWVGPLALYLITFIIAFGRVPSWFRILIGNLAPVMILLLVFVLISGVTSKQVGLSLLLHLLTFFAAALMCHYELARDRPSPQYLTQYFLIMSLGGVLGGIFNSLLAPVVFPLAYEYPLALIIACLMVPNLNPLTHDEKEAKMSHGAALAADVAVNVASVNPVMYVGRWISRLVDNTDRRLARVLDIVIPVLVGLIFWQLQKMPSHFDWYRKMLYNIADVLPFKLGMNTVYIVITYALPVMICFFFVDRPLRFALSVAAILGQATLKESGEDVIYTERSFFGILKIEKSISNQYLHDRTQEDKPVVRGPDGEPLLMGRYEYLRLVHGTTLHGTQVARHDRHVLDDFQMLTAANAWDNLAVLGAINSFDMRQEPLTYYHRTGPVGAMFSELARRGKDREPVAMVGLGSGSVACYAQKGQRLTFYEIDPTVKKLVEKPWKVLNEKELRERGSAPIADPEVRQLVEKLGKVTVYDQATYEQKLREYKEEVRKYQEAVQAYAQELARRKAAGEPPPDGGRPEEPPGPPAVPYIGPFTYVDDARKRGADVDFRLGDARLVLKHDADHKYQLLLVDAFSSDSIPVHLLTTEAVGLYLDRLTGDGILALHISNKYVKLEPVVAAIAKEHNLVARVWNDDAEGKHGKTASSWVVLARTPEALGDRLCSPIGDYMEEFYPSASLFDVIQKKYPDMKTAMEKGLEKGTGKQKEAVLEFLDRKASDPQARVFAHWIRKYNTEHVSLMNVLQGETGYGFRPLDLLQGVDAWTDDYADVMRVMMIPELQAVRKFFGLPTPVER
jgi:hypothetical protein